MLWIALAHAAPAQLVEVAAGLPKVTDIQFQGGRMVVSQQDGTLSWIDAQGRPHRWVKVDVQDGGERGLLGVAFDPDYARNGRVVLAWTKRVGEQTVSHVGLWVTKPGSLPGTSPLHPSTVLLKVVQPYSNHNGGGVQFGPDGMLYVGLGDGGKWGDPLQAGQDGTVDLGSFLRLDPDLPAPHVPPDNPFVGDPNVLDAIWALGVRNPWRFSFAPDGRLVVADVGQNLWEELSFVPRGGNLGWNVKEGWSCYERETCTGAFEEPFWVYGHDLGISVTGGYVATSGPHAGRYLYGDFGTGRLWSIELPASGRAQPPTELGKFDVHPSTFGRDPEGHVYLGAYQQGKVYRID